MLQEMREVWLLDFYSTLLVVSEAALCDIKEDIRDTFRNADEKAGGWDNSPELHKEIREMKCCRDSWKYKIYKIKEKIRKTKESKTYRQLVKGLLEHKEWLLKQHYTKELSEVVTCIDTILERIGGGRCK